MLFGINVFLLAPCGNLHGGSFFRPLKPFWASSRGGHLGIASYSAGVATMGGISCHIVLMLEIFMHTGVGIIRLSVTGCELKRRVKFLSGPVNTDNGI